MKTKLAIIIVSMAFLTGPVIAKHDKHQGLPPGLAKNQKRGKPLPPGWQKKLVRGHILDAEIYHHAKIVVPVNTHGIITVSIEGRLLKLDKVSLKIIDILK